MIGAPNTAILEKLKTEMRALAEMKRTCVGPGRGKFTLPLDNYIDDSTVNVDAVPNKQINV